MPWAGLEKRSEIRRKPPRDTRKSWSGGHARHQAWVARDLQAGAEAQAHIPRPETFRSLTIDPDIATDLEDHPNILWFAR